MSEIRGVILSQTPMSPENFCSTIATRGVGRELIQARLLDPNGCQLRYADLSLDRRVASEQWRRGRMVIMQSAGDFPPRLTHPEDRRVIPSSIKLGDMLTDAQMQRVILGFTYDKIDELFRHVIVGLRNHKAYVNSARVPRSVGYVRCQSVKMERRYLRDDQPMELRATITDSSGTKIDTAIKGCELMEMLWSSQYNRIFKNVLARLALANPMQNKKWHADRCYVMLSDVIL